MVRKRWQSWVFAGLAVVLLAAPAQASFIADGEPVEGNSWSQAFIQSGFGPFDMIAFKMFSTGGTDEFSTPYVSGLPSGWSLNYAAPDLVVFSSDSGAPVTSLNFTLTFNGTAGIEGSVIRTSGATFNDGILVAGSPEELTRGIAGGVNIGAGWRYQPSGSSWADPEGDVQLAMIPLPAPVAMGALGLVGIVLGRKRRERLAG